MKRYHRYLAFDAAARSAPRDVDVERKRALLGELERDRLERADDARRRRTGLALTTVVAALVHGAIVLPLASTWFSSVAEAGPTEVRMVSLAGRSGQKRMQAERPEQPKERPEPLPQREPKAPEEEIPEGQVVSLPPPEQEERPERADYLAEHDQRTDRETRSRDQTRFFKNPTRAPQVGADVPAQKLTTSERVRVSNLDRAAGGPMGPGRAVEGVNGSDAETGGGGTPQFAFEIPRQTFKSRLQLDFSDDGTAQPQEAQEELRSPGRKLRLALGNAAVDAAREQGTGAIGAGTGLGTRGGAGQSGLPSLAELTPSLAELERVAGAPANDYLPEVETDAETRLNAWRWKHSTFFNRVADGIRRTWEGPELLARHDPTGRVYGTQGLTTVLRVTIDRSGNLVSVNVAEPSGAPFLDDEAVRTFRDTAPFANPPQALFGRNDQFTFAFGFNITYETREIDFNWRPY